MRPLRTNPPEPALLILLSLAAGARHGHAMMLDIESFSGVRMGPGSLYGAIERLEREGLIEPIAGDERRRPYRLTEHGLATLRAQIATLDGLAQLGRRRLADA
jgi:DNA-binding PadR family transcriptional regulator